MTGQTLISDWQDVVMGAVSALMLRWQDIRDALGPAPFGWTKGSKWELLESYLDLRDDGAAWGQMVMAYTLQVGELAAVAKVVGDATRMERQLAREGQWDGTQPDLLRALNAGGQVVRGQQALRRLSIAEKGMKAAERELAKPPAWIVGPLSIPTEQELVMGTQPTPAPTPTPTQPQYPPSPYVTGVPSLPNPGPFGPPEQMTMPQGVMA